MRLSATKATAINQYQGLGNQLWDLGGARPSLDLNFAGNKSLTDSISTRNPITFTRASSGTYVGSDGLIKTATTNLLLRSEEIGTSPWATNSPGSVAYTANVIAAPTGAVTADRVTATADFAGPNQFISAVSGLNYAFSFYIKAVTPGALDAIRVECFSGRFAQFNITTRVFSSVNAAITPSSVSVGDGWVRVQLLFTAPSTGSLAVAVYANTSSDFYLWGAQLEQSNTVGEYIPTTSTINSAPRFDHNPTTGESLGLLVEEQRTNSIRNNTMVGAVAGTPGTLPTNWVSVTVAGLTTSVVNTGTQNGINYIDIRVNGTPSTSTYYNIVPDALVAGASGQTWTGSFWGALVGGSLTNTNSQIEVRESDASQAFLANTTNSIALGSGLNRYSLTRTLTNASTAFVSLRLIFQITSGLPIDFTFRVGLPQLEQGAFATSVIPTTTATVTRSADVASITGANFGVSRTNYIRNNTIVGAAAGTPGTLPTNWIGPALSGLTREVVGTGTESGIAYVDVRYFGTTTSALFQSLGFEVTNQIAATQNSIWTSTAFVKLVAGSLANITATRLVIDNYNSSNVALGQYAIANFVPTTAALGTQRYSVSSTSSTFSNAATAFVRPYLQFEANSGAAIDITLRVGLPQLELGSTATAPIPTTNAAVTVFESSWYNQTEGTVFAAFRDPGAGGNRSPYFVSDGSVNNRIGLFNNITTTVNHRVVSGGTSTNPGNLSLAGNTLNKHALAVKAESGGAIAACNGALSTTASPASLPVATQLAIGSFAGVQDYNNAPISRLTYWPIRLPNATLQQITR